MFSLCSCSSFCFYFSSSYFYFIIQLSCFYFHFFVFLFIHLFSADGHYVTCLSCHVQWCYECHTILSASSSSSSFSFSSSRSSSSFWARPSYPNPWISIRATVSPVPHPLANHDSSCSSACSCPPCPVVRLPCFSACLRCFVFTVLLSDVSQLFRFFASVVAYLFVACVCISFSP